MELNCLQCRFCALHPETDFAQKSPTIICGLLKNPRIANFEGCPSAMPTRGYANGRSWSDVARTFLRAHYKRAPMDGLERLLGRQKSGIYQEANRLGLVGLRQKFVSKAAANRLGIRRTWTPEQDAYLQKIYGADEWPVGGAAGAGPDEKAKVRRIIKTVNLLGPPHSWRAIKVRARATTPSGRKRADKRRQCHTIYQREHPKGKKR